MASATTTSSRIAPIFVLICLQFLHISDAISSRTDPKDLQVAVGSTVTLSCGVDNVGQHSIYWYRHKQRKYITKDQKVFHQVGPIWGNFYKRLEVVGESARGEFNLRIDNVTYTDADSYSCVYFLQSRYVSESKAGELKVYEAPAKGFPKCNMAPENGLGPGSSLTIQCLSARSSTGAPNSRLDWHRWFEMLPGSFEQGNNPKASYATKLSEMDNGAVFTCVETSPVLPVPRTCNVTPFLIPTNVTVVSLEGTTDTIDAKSSISHVEVGRDVVLSCLTEAMPPATNYTWLVNGEEVSDASKIVVENGGERLRIPNVKFADNGTSVECKAWNVVLIEGSGDTVLIVEEPAQGSAQASGSPHFGTSNLGIIIGPSIGIIILISIAIYLVVRLRNKKLSSRRDSDTKAADEIKERMRPQIEHHPAAIVMTPEGDSNSEPDETEPLSSVTICSTPHAAIVEHLRELGPGDGEEEGDMLKPDKTASRVLMVGRLSSATSDTSDRDTDMSPHNTSFHNEPVAELYTKPLKHGKGKRGSRGLLKSQISGPISMASDCDSIYMNVSRRSTCSSIAPV